MKLAGLDVGSTACKLCVYEDNGAFVRTIEREYPRQAGHQVDAELLWAAAEDCLREAAAYPDLAAVGVTSFGETCVLLDAAGNPLMDALLYTDPRGQEEAELLARRFGPGRVYEITGLTPNGMYTLPKLMWLKAHEPALWARARYIAEIQDFIVFRLTGIRQTDYSLASRTLAFDVRRLAWNRELLSFAGIPESMLSRPVPTGTPAGPPLPARARALGLPPGIQIVSVSHDQVAAAVGAGVLAPGLAADGGGTVQCVTPVYRGFPSSPAMAEGQFSVVPYLEENQFASYAFFFTGGALLQWFRDGLLEKGAEGGAFYPRMNARLPGGPTGLLTLPHFSGAGTPFMDARATGAILGLTTRTTQPQLYKALMEGVAYEMRLNLEKLREAGIAVTHLRATGGASRSPEWMQIKADILGLPITRLKNEQCGAVGSILLAGRAIGAYLSLKEAAAHFARPAETYTPCPRLHAEYTALYEKYRRLYRAAKEVMDP